MENRDEQKQSEFVGPGCLMSSGVVRSSHITRREGM